MTKISKLPLLKVSYEDLVDNPDYHHVLLWTENPSNYLIVYEYIHPLLDIANELILNNIEFSHYACHLSDHSYLLVNKNQLTFN